MSLLTLLLIEIVSALNKHCNHYYYWAIGECSLSATSPLLSVKYDCEKINSTHYQVIQSRYSSLGCSGDPWMYNTLVCDDRYCNCDGSKKDCSLMTISRTSCDNDSDYHQSLLFVTDVCFLSYFGDYLSYHCNDTGGLDTIYYDDANCTQISNTGVILY